MEGRVSELEREIGISSAQAHAALARVAVLSAEFDELGGWAEGGIRSFAHWLSLWAGFAPHTGSELLRIGQALRSLPRLAAAFAAGQVSYDKVRLVTLVATAETDEFMTEIARGATGAQLERICRSIRRMLAAEDEGHRAQRGLWFRLEDDGLVRLTATLTAEEGEIVKQALEAISASMTAPGTPDDGADDRWAARRVDALVAMSDDVLSGAAGSLIAPGESRQLVVHVDVGVLTGEGPDGLCNLENGVRVSAEAARRIGCDATVIPVVERDGLPIDVGRKRRTAPPRLRRALEVRDRFCRYPGCRVPARRTQAHHHDQWFLGGGTNLGDMLLLCGFHHRTLHEGGYRIVRDGPDFRFETDDGVTLGAGAPVEPGLPPAVDADAARSEWDGARLDFDHLMFVVGQEFVPN